MATGVVALVPDSWGGVWMPRHQVLARLSRRMPVVWLDKAPHWRENLLRRRETGAWVEGAPVATSSLHIESRRWWEGEFYRPAWLRRLGRTTSIDRARRILRRRGCDRLVLYLWRPEFAYALDAWDWDLAVYHIDDEYSFSEADAGLSPEEKHVIESVDQVIVHSPRLMQRKGQINPNTVEIPNGVDFALFSAPREEPLDLAAIPRPRAGYVGVVKKQLDLALVAALARRHPRYSFVLAGPISHAGEIGDALEKLRALGNVHLLGRKHPLELPAYMQHLDVGLLCYRVNAYTDCIYPLKLHEYLAAGTPVVGAPIRSLRDHCDVVALASDLDEWSAAIAVALGPEAHSAEAVAARRAVAMRHDWDRIVNRIADTIEGRLAAQTAAGSPRVSPGRPGSARPRS